MVSFSMCIKRSVVTFFLLLICSTWVSAGTYSESAHGDSLAGVNRQATSTSGYARGNCAHCHEQHTSINGQEPAPVGGSPSGYLLLSDQSSSKTTGPYSQSDNVCFNCHTSTGSIQQGSFANQNYSSTFAGAPATTNSILDAFNQRSYHNLYDVRRFITGQSGTKNFADFPAGSSSCDGCHNVHLAKRNHATPGDPTKTAISKPSDHNNLFGDDSPTERMTDPSYGGNYQSPKYFASSSLEPDGLGSIQATQAAKTPDYSEFCSDCHNATNTIYSTTLGRNLKKVDWEIEKHGKGNADGYLSVDPPFIAGASSLGYVLSCLDCHEPHGSPYPFLLRSSINGATLTTPPASTDTLDWNYVCDSCHDNSNGQIHHFSADQAYAGSQCGRCHGSNWHCVNCHYHGSWVNDPANPLDRTPDYAPTTRVTF